MNNMDWINTSEQLPEKDQEVLGTSVDNDGWVNWVILYFDGTYFIESRECCHFFPSDFPYWQPLPSPPPELTEGKGDRTKIEL